MLHMECGQVCSTHIVLGRQSGQTNEQISLLKIPVPIIVPANYLEAMDLDFSETIW
jgi:hypothetical protein